METILEFNKYMEYHYNFKGLWDSPSCCGLRIIKRRDGNTLVIASEIYRQNPGTAITECIAPLATQILQENHLSPDQLIFIEHSPDLKSRLTFYGETFDLLSFTWDGNRFTDPIWSRLTQEQVDKMMEE